LTDVADERLSRTLSMMLRHDPSRFGLVLDGDGWASLPDVLVALRAADSEWSNLSREDLERMIAAATKQRHQVSGNLIRALYGHSTPDEISHDVASPPAVLYHGTSPDAWTLIQFEGLRPMRRQFVHLSVDPETAQVVGRRKARVPVVLRVRALDAHYEGVSFMVGNDRVWLVSHVPRKFISLADSNGARALDR
jgi:putative RNA 2'-phosphotransferase